MELSTSPQLGPGAESRNDAGAPRTIHAVQCQMIATTDTTTTTRRRSYSRPLLDVEHGHARNGTNGESLEGRPGSSNNIITTGDDTSTQTPSVTQRWSSKKHERLKAALQGESPPELFSSTESDAHESFPSVPSNRCWTRWSRCVNVGPPLYTLACLLGYGIALYVNSITGSLLGDESPSESIFLLSFGRACALTIVLPLLWTTRDTSQQPGLLRATIPALIAVAGNSAFLAYYALVSGGGEVSILAPMVGLYSVIPILWGLLARGESRTWQKMVGIAVSFIAVLVLAFGGRSFDSGGAGGSSAAAVAFKIAMFAIVFVVWGVDDAIASGVKLDPFTTALSSWVGQIFCCAVYGFVAFVEATDKLAANSIDGGASLNRVPFGMPHLAVMGANALGILAWLSFVKLGQMSAASLFIPVISLYVYIPVLLSVLLRGESLTPAKVAGLVLAGVAIVLLSRDWEALGTEGGPGVLTRVRRWLSPPRLPMSGAVSNTGASSNALPSAAQPSLAGSSTGSTTILDVTSAEAAI